MTRIARARLAPLLVMALCLPPASASANSQSSRPTDGALGDTVWYDAGSEKVVPVHVRPVVDDSLNRDSRWLPQAKRVKQPETPTTAGGGGGGGGGGAGTGLFGSGLTIVNLLGWLLLVAIIAAAVGALAYVLSRAEVDPSIGSRSSSGGLASEPDQQTIERMKHLPAELRRTDVNLRSEAERLMNQGQYDQAIILLFGHQLLMLDRVGMLRLNRGKTNRKYIRETRASDADSARQLQGTVSAFERSYFGGHAITQQQFAELWRVNSELEQAVGRRGEVAA
jgi:hypothetical protein